MYAIIHTGGKQLRVAVGDAVEVELLPAQQGETVTFDRVLMLCREGEVQIGKPYLDGTAVVAEMVGEVQGEKIHSVKYRKRKRSRRRWGHRQRYSLVKITSIGEVALEGSVENGS